jgi:hypothetical protein
MTNPHRKEIEHLLRTQTRSHFAQTFVLVEAGLEDAEIAVNMNVSPQRSARVRKAVQLVLSDEVIPAKTWASIVAAIYREFLNYSISESLRQHAKTRIAQCQAIDPAIPSSPLGNLVLGANARPKQETPQEVCRECFTIHSGECL